MSSSRSRPLSGGVGLRLSVSLQNTKQNLSPRQGRRAANLKNHFNSTSCCYVNCGISAATPPHPPGPPDCCKRGGDVCVTRLDAPAALPPLHHRLFSSWLKVKRWSTPGRGTRRARQFYDDDVFFRLLTRQNLLRQRHWSDGVPSAEWKRGVCRKEKRACGRR